MEPEAQEDRTANGTACSVSFPLRLSVNERNNIGETILHATIKIKALDFATVFLSEGGDVNIADKDGNTPFSLAMDSRSPELVDLLLRHNPDFNLKIIREKFYGYLLSSSADIKTIVKSIVRHGFAVKKTDNINSTKLWAAILLGLEEIAISFVNYQRLLLRRVKVWYKCFLLHVQPFNDTQAEALRIIVEIINQFSRSNKVEMADNHNYDLFTILLSKYDKELFKVNTMNIRSFYTNDSERVVAITKVLLSCYDGENPVCDKQGRTGLHYAAMVGNAAVIKALLDLNLDIDATETDGKTPLDYVSDRINAFPHYDIRHAQHVYTAEHYDSRFNCWYSLLDFKVSAFVLCKEVIKLSDVKYLSPRTQATARFLSVMMMNDSLVMTERIRFLPPRMAIYSGLYATLEDFEQRSKKEIDLLKREKLTNDLTYFEFLTKSINQVAVYAIRKEVIDTLHSNNDILKEFKIYGPMLQQRFITSNFRRVLVENAENALFDVLRPLAIPLVIVRKILNYFNNEELSVIL